MATAFVTASVAGMKEKNKKKNAISRHGYNSRLQHVTTKPSFLYLREKVKFVLSLVVTYSIFFFFPHLQEIKEGLSDLDVWLSGCDRYARSGSEEVWSGWKPLEDISVILMFKCRIAAQMSLTATEGEAYDCLIIDGDRSPTLLTSRFCSHFAHSDK